MMKTEPNVKDIFLSELNSLLAKHHVTLEVELVNRINTVTRNIQPVVAIKLLDNYGSTLHDFNPEDGKYFNLGE
jgi:hypothetical protein